jgi:hypothetical protein
MLHIYPLVIYWDVIVIYWDFIVIYWDVIVIQWDIIGYSMGDYWLYTLW